MLSVLQSEGEHLPRLLCGLKSGDLGTGLGVDKYEDNASMCEL